MKLSREDYTSLSSYVTLLTETHSESRNLVTAISLAEQLANTVSDFDANWESRARPLAHLYGVFVDEITAMGRSMVQLAHFTVFLRSLDVINFYLHRMVYRDHSHELQLDRDMQEVVLRQAVRRNATTMVGLFLGDGFSVNQCDDFGRTLLHLASWHEERLLLDLLLLKGADVKARDNSNDNALHHAVRNRSVQCLQSLLHTELIDAIYDTNKDGLRPIDIARNLGDRHCSLLLADAEATIPLT